MKNTLIMMTVAIILGGVSGMFLFSKYENSSYVFNENKKLYFLEEGVYSTSESVDANTKKLKPKLVLKQDNKYHVYVGITSNVNNVSKIKKMYREQGYSVYEKEVEVDNDGFISNVGQFDVLLESSDSDNDIKTIEEIVLSNYEELNS